MAESAIRVLIGAAVVLTAVGVAGWARRAQRRGAVTAPLALDGIPGRIVLFSDAACARCDQARAVLETVGEPFSEVAFEADPGLMAAAGVGAVPLVVVRRADGTEVGRIAGKVSARRLRRLVKASGD